MTNVIQLRQKVREKAKSVAQQNAEIREEYRKLEEYARLRLEQDSQEEDLCHKNMEEVQLREEYRKLQEYLSCEITRAQNHMKNIESILQTKCSLLDDLMPEFVRQRLHKEQFEHILKQELHKNIAFEKIESWQQKLEDMNSHLKNNKKSEVRITIQISDLNRAAHSLKREIASLQKEFKELSEELEFLESKYENYDIKELKQRFYNSHKNFKITQKGYESIRFDLEHWEKICEDTEYWELKAG